MRLGRIASKLWGPGLVVALCGPAMGGPARYDRDSKSFAFTYTFATLPGAVGAGQATTGTLVGSVQRPSTEQESTVNALVGQVSDVLYRATGGRAKVGRLDYVDDIKQADIVVSLTGQPASAGWAIRGAIGGQPGQVVLYYQSLVPEIKQDVIYTAAHELCHYIFGLTDEYTPAYAPGCPPRTGTPGCLMDNYLSGARGWMGRFCTAEDHNTHGDQRQSCQSIVDAFFQAQGMNDAPSAVDPRPLILQTAIGQVRARTRADIAANRPVAAVEAFARRTLSGLLDEFNRQGPTKALFSSAQLAEAVRQVVKFGSMVPILRPAALEEKVFDQIKAEAERLAAGVAAERSETTRASKIRSGLVAFIAQLKKLEILRSPDLPAAEQRQLVDRLAKDGARPAAERNLDRLVGVGDLNVRLERSIAENVVRVLDALNEPGTPARLGELAAFDAELKQFAIPGRTSARFGLRRTRLITPDPLYPEEFGNVLTQGGVFPYAAIRDRSIVQFSRLVDRARIELVRPTQEVSPNFAPLEARIDRPFDRIPAEDPSMARASTVNLRAVIKDTLDQLERNRLENLALLVPPGGLPRNFGDQIQIFQAKLKSGIDMRIDAVLVGSTDIPRELRHLIVASRGSVLTVTDIDEVGAISQRLKNEQSSGSWVVVPQQSTFGGPQPVPAPVDLKALAARVADARQKLAAQLKPLGEQIELKPVGGILQGLESAKLEIRGLDGRLMDLAKLFPPEAAAPLEKGRARQNAIQAQTAIVAMNRLISSLQRNLRDLDGLIGDEAPVKALREMATKFRADFGDDLGKLARLRADFEAALETSLDKADAFVPIFKRIDRGQIEAIRLGIEDARFGAQPSPGPTAVRLGQFYAERQDEQVPGEFELIVGLSRELKRLPPDTGGEPRPKEPKLSLRDVRQISAVRTPGKTAVTFDPDTSTPTLLVYRSQRPFTLAEGWYTPVLEFDAETYKDLLDQRVNFTFSIGSSRPNIQLIAGLRQPADERNRGTLILKTLARPEAVVEVQVSAGSSVLGASLRGLAQRIDDGTGPIVPEPVDFADDGKGPDRTAADGVYTGVIPLVGVTLSTEFRVFVQADTTDGKATYIALDDPASATKTPKPADPARAAEQALAQGAVERFQRATSVHFRVEP